MYIINTYGYTGGPTFLTITAARKALAEYKREDRAACKRRFGTAKVSSDKDGYVVEAGANLWSAARINKY